MLVKFSMTMYILYLQVPVYILGRWILLTAAVINVSSASVFYKSQETNFDIMLLVCHCRCVFVSALPVM